MQPEVSEAVLLSGPDGESYTLMKASVPLQQKRPHAMQTPGAPSHRNPAHREKQDKTIDYTLQCSSFWLVNPKPMTK